MRRMNPPPHNTIPAGWTLEWEHRDGLLGWTNFTRHTITLNPRQLSREAACTLCHELIHIERGPLPANLWLAAREEHLVEVETARRMIHIDRLGDALAWSITDRCETAEDLGVDCDTLNTRLTHLTTAEDNYLRARTNHWEAWA